MKWLIWIIRIIRSFLQKLKQDCISAYSAQAAFFIIISFFPLVMFLLTFFQFLPLNDGTIVEVVQAFMPSAFADYVINIIQEILTVRSTTAIISVTAITALWSGSKSFLAIIRGMNSVYGIPERRNYFHLRVICALYSFVFSVLLVILFVLLMFGNQLFQGLIQLIPGLSDYILPAVVIRVLASFAILFLFFLLLYMIIPSCKVTAGQAFWGALFASAGWFIFTFLYSFYIDNLYSSTIYGSLTTVVLLMLWLYICMYIMFIGAEINVWLEALGSDTHMDFLSFNHSPNNP